MWWSNHNLTLLQTYLQYKQEIKSTKSTSPAVNPLHIRTRSCSVCYHTHPYRKRRGCSSQACQSSSLTKYFQTCLVSFISQHESKRCPRPLLPLGFFSTTDKLMHYDKHMEEQGLNLQFFFHNCIRWRQVQEPLHHVTESLSCMRPVE